MSEESYALLVQSIAKPELKFLIVRVDPATKKARLRGTTGVEFDEILSKEKLAELGYKVVREKLPPMTIEDECDDRP